MSSALTGGQLVKAIASFLGPIVAATASSWLGDWKLIFPAFAIVSLLNTGWLLATPIAEDALLQNTSSPGNSLRLMKDPFIVQLVLGVVAIVGIDVGLNTTLPHFLMLRCGLLLEKAGLGTSLYFIARTTGSLAGVLLLTKIKNSRFFSGSALTGLLGLAGLLIASSLGVLLPLIFLIGFSVANIFPIIFAAALRRVPERENEVSGLLIVGVSGGAILLPLMGFAGDAGGPVRALGVLLVAWGWLVWVGKQIG